MSRPLRIAVASSGLPHVARGVEAWAEETAAALQRRGEAVKLFQGTGDSQLPFRVALGCLSRLDPAVETWARRLNRAGLWRFGLSNAYDLEQCSFAVKLWRKIRRDFDILHVQDPVLALWMTRMHRMGMSRPRVILGHGTEEPPAMLRRYQVLQHLAPAYLAAWEQHRPAAQLVFAIPNFIDVERFRPGDKPAARAAWNLPADSFVVLTVAALKSHHKRVDYLIREMSQLPVLGSRPAILVMAGAWEQETDAIVRLCRELLGDRGHVLINVPRDRLPSLYQAADVFALGSLHEMLSVALCEALASGLPVCCNNSPTLQWMVGDAGRPGRLTDPGALRAQLAPLASEEKRVQRSRAARNQAVSLFSEQAVVPQFMAMYQSVMAGVP